MRRYITFDFIRGFGIIAVIIFHRIVWDYYYTNSGLETTTELKLDLLGILFLFLSMAGIFYVISGAVNSYVNYSRIKNNKISIKQLISSGWITGISLILISYVFRLLFFRAIKDWTALATYYVLYEEIRSTKFTIALASGTLWIIGAVIILVTTILSIYFYFQRFNKIYHLYLLYLLIGIVIIVLTLPMTILLAPSVEDSAYSENWIYFFFFAPLVYGYFPLFPYLGFGCFGAILGVMLARNESKKIIFYYLGIGAILSLMTGLLFFGNSGALVISYYSIDAIKNLFGRQILQLGIFLVVISFLLFIFDFRSEKHRLKWSRITYWVNEFGKNALTIYVFEGFVSAILIRLISPFWFTYSSTVINAAFFGLLNLFVWVLLVLIWRRTGYIGSLEWLIINLIEKFNGKKSDHFKEIKN